jgi:hypothetical protein
MVTARIADHEAGVTAHHLLSARAQRSRSSMAATEVGKPTVKSRRATSVVEAMRKGSKPPPQLIAPTRCSIPSWRACHQVPRIWVMPVPGGAVQRQRAKRVPETVPWDSRVKLFRWMPAKGSAPGGMQ